MLRRSFRNVAVIAGLIERRFPGEEKSRRQVTFSSDLIYDALRRHEPDHILLRATRQDAASESCSANSTTWRNIPPPPAANSYMADFDTSSNSNSAWCMRR